MKYSFAGRIIARGIIPFVYLWYIRKIDGLDKVPTSGGFIVAPNHVSYFDDPIPMAILVRRNSTLIRSLVNSRFWKHWLSKWFLDAGHCIPVYVDKTAAAKQKNDKSIQHAAQGIESGHVIQVFPEGTRSADATLKRGHHGVARLALLTGAPVIPMGIIGTDKIMPKGAFFPRFARCDVKFGKPLRFEKKQSFSKKELEDVTRTIMKSIGSLIGQRYEY